MDRNSFIQQYVASFLASRAAIRYDNGGDWKWVYTQPVEDARYLAEKAWETVYQSIFRTQSTTATTGSVGVATIATDSTPITSSTLVTEDQTPSTTSSPSAGGVTEPPTTGS